MEYDDYGNAANPGRTDLGPYIGSLKRPRRKQHNKLIRLVQELANVFLEFRPNVNVGLIKKWLCPTRRDFPGDLTSYPRVFARVTDKNQSCTL